MSNTAEITFYTTTWYLSGEHCYYTAKRSRVRLLNKQKWLIGDSKFHLGVTGVNLSRMYSLPSSYSVCATDKDLQTPATPLKVAR